MIRTRPADLRTLPSSTGGGDDLHPFIRGLLGSLPEPDTAWAGSERAKWLTTASNIFSLLYQGDDGEIEVRYLPVKPSGSNILE